MRPTTPPVRESEPDRVFRALSERRRRSVLRILNREGATCLVELARELVAGATDPGTSASETDVRIDLYHRHVPILSAAGLVRYAADRNVVLLTASGASVATRLTDEPR